MLLLTSIKLHTAFPLAYLRLTLTHSKGQGEGRAHFDCQYLVNGDKIWQTLLYYFQQIESLIRPFCWQIYILH